MNAQNHIPTSWYRQTIAGLIIIGVGLGGFGVWASTASLDSAIISDGIVTVEGERQQISHFEGGMVQDILVEDADFVQAGEVLIRLIPLQAQSDVATLRARMITARARAVRLEAERDGLQELVFPEDLLADAGEAYQDILDDTVRQFEGARQTVATQIEILESRKEQLNKQISGRSNEMDALREQSNLLQTELESLRAGVETEVVPRNRLLASERERTRIEGEIGRAFADIAGFEERIAETELEMEQLLQERREAAIAELPITRIEEIEARAGLDLALDALSRVEVRAPTTGNIQNLSVQTVGGVVAPGEPLMELVPSERGLVVTARLSPLDRDSLSIGLEAEVRFPAFSTRTTPVILGEVRRVSPDILTDDRSGEQYYEMLVHVQDDSIPDAIDNELVPGLPAQVVVATGERTPLNYLVKPLREVIFRAGREE